MLRQPFVEALPWRKFRVDTNQPQHDQAFSALKESGNVISWGNESDGGCSRHAHVFFLFGWVESRWMMKMDENGTWQPDCPSGDILARPEDRGEASFPVKFLLPHQCPKGARLAAYHALKYATVAVTTSLMNLIYLSRWTFVPWISALV